MKAIKEPVRIRFRNIKNGCKSVYLDTYINGIRHYEFLKLYIIPEKTAFDKAQNKETLRTANAIKAQRNIEIINNKGGITQSAKPIGLVSFIDLYIQNKNNVSTKTKQSYIAFKNHILNYDKHNTKLSNIDDKWILEFVDYLRKEHNENTVVLYYSKLITIFKEAQRKSFVTRNPFDTINKTDIPKRKETQRNFLTIEEVQKIEKVQTIHEEVKNAFLFCCFSGLRWSDVKNLHIDNLYENDGQKFITIRMQKTDRVITIPLSKNAIKHLPLHPLKSGFVFKLPTLTTANTHLKEIAQSANLNKSVSFHCSRHTFATMLLTKGADLYTTSKLLGHTNIQTTQIYARIVDEKKIQSVSLLDDVI